MVRRRFWAVLDRWMRKLHLWTGLFLVPWMMVYAVSAFFLNHPVLNRALGNRPPQWRHVRTVDFVPDDTFPHEPKAQAARIVEFLGLDGAHRIQGKPNPNQMAILRISASGHYRIVWNKRRRILVVSQQEPFSAVRMAHFLHFRAGYGQPYASFRTWAVVVDLVAASIVLWVVSGLYLWTRMPKVRVSGGICLAVGCTFFAALVAAFLR